MVTEKQTTTRTYRPGIDPDRRQRASDKLTNTLTWISWMSWGLILFAVILLDRAQPKLLTSETQWNEQLLVIIYYVLLIILGLSMSGIMLNRKRRRRKEDAYRYSLIITLAISLGGLMLLLFR